MAQPTGPIDEQFANVIATMTHAFIGKLVWTFLIESGLCFERLAIDAFRRRTFVLLSKAYTSITLSDAQTYLGLEGEQVVQGMYERSL